MKEEIIASKKGFIAALDQSGGSSAKTLSLYGINEDMYHSEEEMFEEIHKMRKRIITNKVFNNKYILGVIIFKKTMESKIDDLYTAEYLWEEKQIPTFLKIDVGLENIDGGVQVLKDIPNLDEILDEAISHGVVGTKMRSVIHEYNEYGIKKVIEQQFNLAKKIMNKGLIPIIEPEVSIKALNKEKIEMYLKEQIKIELKKLKSNGKLIFKFTIPNKANLYDELLRNKNVLRIVALSGGYKQEEACKYLKENKKMIASFSRALLEGLKYNQSEEEFTKQLENSIINIYNASIKKN